MNLVLAGTATDVLMIEGACDFLPEETLLEALEVSAVEVVGWRGEGEGGGGMCGAARPRMNSYIPLVDSAVCSGGAGSGLDHRECLRRVAEGFGQARVL